MSKATGRARRVPSPPELAKEMRRMIKRGDFQPGDHLSGSILAEHFGVSPAPVREALRLLESSGLVRIEPQRGAFVARLEDEESLQTLNIIAAIYGLAAHLAALRATDEQKADMRHAVGLYIQAADDPNTTPVQFIKDGDDFFLPILKAARSDRVFLMLRDLSVGAGSYYAPFSAATQAMRQTAAENARLMVEAICSGDSEAALLQGFRNYQNRIDRAREMVAISRSVAAAVDPNRNPINRLVRKSGKRRRVRAYPP